VKATAHRVIGISPRHGQTLVEFALVFPVFVLMLFGIVDAGRFVYMNSVLSQAAREGARLAAVEASWIGSSDPSCGAVGGPVCPADATALTADATAAANRMIDPFGSVSALYISCDVPVLEGGSGPPTGDWTTGTPCTTNSDATNNVVSVRVLLTFHALTPVIGQVLGSMTMSGSATMVIN
jgi:Flp pilus assembly protein TadG